MRFTSCSCSVTSNDRGGWGPGSGPGSRAGTKAHETPMPALPQVVSGPQCPPSRRRKGLRGVCGGGLMGPTFHWPDLDHSAPPRCNRGVGKCHLTRSLVLQQPPHVSWGQRWRGLSGDNVCEGRVGPWEATCVIPGVRQRGGYNMEIFYFRDNKNEIGLLRPPPGLRGKTLPSSGPSPRILISPGPALLGPRPPFPSIPPPLCSQSPVVPACFPALGRGHLASRLLLTRSLFCTLSLMFIMYRHH